MKSLFGANDNEWVVLVGRYMLNMGVIEMATRLLVFEITGSDQEPIYSDDLAARIGFLRKRYPRNNREKHENAMRCFHVADRHTRFRNIVAHSVVVVTENEDGEKIVQGLLSLTPKNKTSIGEVVGLEEIRGRVNESSAIGQAMLEMQGHYSGGEGT